MSDEELYLQATREVDSENKDDALWAKAIALADGEQEKAKYKYIKLRVEKLQDQTSESTPSSTNKSPLHPDKQHRNPNTKFLLQTAKRVSNRNYIPINEFSKAQGESVNEIINKVREGFYDGQLIGNEWYVEYSELSKSDIELPEPGGLSWNKFIIWVGILYFITLIGVLIKESEKINNMVFQNVWQYATLAIIPVMYMFWFGVISFIYLSYNRFNIQRAGFALSMIAICYVFFALFRILSSQPV